MTNTEKKVFAIAAIWSIGIYAYQRIYGPIINTAGTQAIPGFLDPIGYFVGYPNAVQATVGDAVVLN